LGIPLLAHGRSLGAITVVAQRGRTYTSADLDLGRDLGVRTALTVQNAALYQSAQTALRARDEFLAIAAHEIRGPISAIQLAVQSIARGKVPPEALPGLLELINRQNVRLSQFVDELLEL